MSRELYYGDYLQLERLLDSQRLESEQAGKPAHDEMLFIIVHQAYELWFKQILWEIEAVHRLLDPEPVPERNVARALAHLERIHRIQKILIDQIDVLESMTPLDFLDFRDHLIPASGFQSVQFRLIENRLGLTEEMRLRFEKASYTARLSDADRARLRDADAGTSIFELVERWLERTPFIESGDFDFWDGFRRAVDDMLLTDERVVSDNETLSEAEQKSQLRALEQSRRHFAALFNEDRHAELVASGHRRMSLGALKAGLLIHLYRDEPILHVPFRLLQALVEIDENMTLWRHRHALMVLRMIGTKVGTGGSSGHDYLRRTALEHRVFEDLFNLSSFLIPRSRLPELPRSLRERMAFRYESSAS
jgi:tryptophan 2,3-dioxygenase